LLFVRESLVAILCGVSQFERDILIERTYAGLAQARLEGRVGGRKDVIETTAKKLRMTPNPLRAEIRQKIANGGTSRGLAKAYGVSHTTISKAAKAANNTTEPADPCTTESTI
jgi:putative DNA-invertase from lambdoid prophage Rac